MKTLDIGHFKNKVAEENGFSYWGSTAFERSRRDHIDSMMDEAANRFAAHVWEEAIAAQKLICAKEAKTIVRRALHNGIFGHERINKTVVDKESILNAPDAVNPFKK